jgi:hypothetical protein
VQRNTGLAHVACTHTARRVEGHRGATRIGAERVPSIGTTCPCRLPCAQVLGFVSMGRLPRRASPPCYDLLRPAGAVFLGFFVRSTVRKTGLLRLNALADLSVPRWTLFYTLQKVHHCGIVHGDFAPRNVILDTDGQPILIDFELAIETHDCTGYGRCGELVRAAHQLGLVLNKDIDHELVRTPLA